MLALREHIDNHLNEKLSLGELSKLAGPAALFTKYNGMTVHIS